MKMLKLVTPPILYRLFVILFRKKVQRNWSGNYISWKEAQEECTGYDLDSILQKVKESMLKVKNNEAVYERDSMLFDKKEYSWALLSNLFFAASQNNNKLNVLDFGGSLGSTYYQNSDFFEHLDEFNWNIVEQTGFVKEGKDNFENDTLKFYYTIEDCINENVINVLILSSVIQYIEKPFELIDEILKYNFDFIIIDRTSFINEGKTIITKQVVPDYIYKASYPMYFFNENEFLSKFKEKYFVENDFKSFCDHEKFPLEKSFYGSWKGFMFMKNNN